MTDNEIIKALKDEIRRANYIESYYIDCVNIGVFQNALNLINRQKAENDSLKVDLAKCSIRLDNLYKTADEIKSEARKEFADRLKEEMSCEDDCGYHCSDCHYECKDYVPVINNVLKEMEK